MPDAPADDSSDQPDPAAAESSAPSTPSPDIPLLPDPPPPTPVTPPRPMLPPALVTPPAQVTPPAFTEPPTVVTPPADYAPPATVEPPTVVTPPGDYAPPATVEPPTVAAPSAGYAPPATVEPGTVIVPAGVRETAFGGGPPGSAFPATAPWQAPAPWPPAAYAGQPGPGYPPGWTGGPPPPPGFLYPGTGAPAPKRSRAAVIISVVAVVVVLACLGFGTVAFFAVRHLDAAPVVNASVPTEYPTDLPTDDPTGDPTDDPLPDAEPTHGGDIKRYVIERSATSQTWPKVKAEQALDLQAAAANFANPGEGKLVLQRYGFKDGYTRRWIDESGSYIIVRVLRFTDAGGGDNFASFYIDANQASGWGEPADVPNVPDAAGFVKPKAEKNGFQRSMAVGDSGDIVAIVIADQLPPASPSLPDSLLYNEFGLL